MDEDRERTPEERVQTLLLAAKQLIIEAGKIADDEGLDGVTFMGLEFVPNFGWVDDHNGLQEPSQWNSSWCTIGLEDREWSSSGAGC